jgi:hypothetical protein
MEARLMIEGETIASGAKPRCDDCRKMPKLDVYLSGGGFYIGTYCDCGPYSRESGYFHTREEAQAAFQRGGYER